MVTGRVANNFITDQQVSLGSEDLFTVGENVRHMVIKSFTWQVPMQMHPLLCRTANAYIQQQKKRFFRVKGKQYALLIPPCAGIFGHTHSPGALVELQDFFCSYLDPLLTNILFGVVQLEFSRCSFRALHLDIYSVFCSRSIGDYDPRLIFFVPWSESWRLLLWPWCFFSRAQNRS